MNKRELEMARRYLDELIDMENAAWIAVVQNTSNVGWFLARHDALKHAVKLAEAEVARLSALAVA